MPSITEQSKAFTWETYNVPQREGAPSVTQEGYEETFKIRHMKAGRTGARKTWSGAHALLKYLTFYNGLHNKKQHHLDDMKKKIDDDDDDDDVDDFDSSVVLDMGVRNSSDNGNNNILTLPPIGETCNILELGGGSGYVSIGLSKAFHSSSKMSLSSCQKNKKTKNVLQILCTDMDKNTIKNMRHNICENKETKTISVEKLEWGNDVGGDTFAIALKNKFQNENEKEKKKSLLSLMNQNQQDGIHTNTNNNNPTEQQEEEDPIRLLTHVIASDVHYGETTLDPLSSIISSIKYRTPNTKVIMMMKERSPNAVTELVEQIERKVHVLRSDEQNNNNNNSFKIHVRDVILPTDESELLKMKLIEC